MTYDLKFTDQEMQVLNMALGELPAKFALPLIQSINRQIMEARAPAEEQPASE